MRWERASMGHPAFVRSANGRLRFVLSQVSAARPGAPSPEIRQFRRSPAVEAFNLTVAITGASGAVLGREMLRALEADGRVARVHFVASEESVRGMAGGVGVYGR